MEEQGGVGRLASEGDLCTLAEQGSSRGEQLSGNGAQRAATAWPVSNGFHLSFLLLPRRQTGFCAVHGSDLLRQRCGFSIHLPTQRGKGVQDIAPPLRHLHSATCQPTSTHHPASGPTSTPEVGMYVRANTAVATNGRQSTSALRPCTHLSTAPLQTLALAPCSPPPPPPANPHLADSREEPVQEALRQTCIYGATLELQRKDQGGQATAAVLAAVAAAVELYLLVLEQGGHEPNFVSAPRPPMDVRGVDAGRGKVGGGQGAYREGWALKRGDSHTSGFTRGLPTRP